MSKYDFSLKQPKKTAKDTLLQCILDLQDIDVVPKQISFLGFSVNTIDRLRDGIGKLDDKTAEQAIKTLKNRLQTFS